MKIKNINGLSADHLQKEVNSGGKFIYYAFTISLIVVTFKRTSGVYLIRGGENAVVKGLPFSVITFLLGWWGIPWGPKHSFESLRTNFQGGKNVTDEVMSVVAGYVLFHETQKKHK
ncbi:MAG: hypothetical protein ABUT20_11905 [Bacteroidota bacterium]